MNQVKNITKISQLFSISAEKCTIWLLGMSMGGFLVKMGVAAIEESREKEHFLQTLPQKIFVYTDKKAKISY